MSIDLGQLGKLMLDLEARIHRDGWDKPPTAWLFYDGVQVATDQTMRGGFQLLVRRGSYVAARMIRVPGYEPWKAVRTFALNLAYAGGVYERDRLLELMQLPGVFAFGVMYEALFNDDPQIRERMMAGELHLGDVPSSRELRALQVVELNQRCHDVKRIRGEKPELDLGAPIRGDINTSLRLIVDTVKGLPAPATEQEWDRRYPSLAQLLIDQKGHPG